jgi:serine/threonine-protein kinase PRP4
MMDSSSRDYRDYDAPPRVDRNRERNGDRHGDRGRDRDRDRYHDESRRNWGSRPRSPSYNGHRDEGVGNRDTSSFSGNGRGRGRGRGRGAGINVPAWMKDDQLNRQVQQENNSSLSSQMPHQEEKKTDQEIKESKLAKPVEEKIEKEVQEKTLEQQKEDEELQNLAAQFEDADAEKDDEDVDMFSLLENDEEKEERLAKERRERRRKRLRETKPSNDLETIPKKQHIEETKLESTQTEEIVEEVDNFNQNKIMGAAADNTGNVDGQDSFDIFSSNVSPPTKTQVSTVAATSGTGLDDADGYYRATIGEIMTFTSSSTPDAEPTSCSFRVQGIIGKGVFSTVLKCSRVSGEGTQSITDQADVVAIKLIRSNETMAKAAQKEVHILRLLNPGGEKSNGSNKPSKDRHIVKMYELDELSSENRQQGFNDAQDQSYRNSILLEYQNHTAIIFEHLPFNLRETLSKFGKNVGITLSAVRSYAKQLLTALQHLAVHRVVHADIKLDNILVGGNFSTVKLCDFGSAFFETDSDLIMTPYLVSRFYRAPEIMLGLPYDGKIDLWSVAVSLAELFTGSVLFPGRTNNDMLKRFMECKGPFSNKMIRRHVAGFSQLGLQPHFEATATGGGSFNFRQQDFDKVTGKPVIRVVGAGNMIVPNKQIVHVLLRSRSSTDSRGEVQKFGEFLSKCLALDPVKRITVDDALKHDFFTTKKKMPDNVVVED